jgi:hypothetical protein
MHQKQPPANTACLKLPSLPVFSAVFFITLSPSLKCTWISINHPPVHLLPAIKEVQNIFCRRNLFDSMKAAAHKVQGTEQDSGIARQ